MRIRERDIYFFSLFVSLSDLWKSDRRFFSEQKEKLDYATRATRACTNILAFRQTSRGRKFSYLCYFKPKGYVMA